MSNGCIRLALFTPMGTGPAAEALLDRWAQDSDRAEGAKRGHPENARRFLLGRSLVRALIERTTGSDGRACRFAVDDAGKPSVELAPGQPGPAISISHSGVLVVAALTDLGQLGVDVEQHLTNRSLDAIAGYAFGPRERKAATATSDDFYRIWCLREAMSKATGRGLAEAADGIDRVQDVPRDGRLVTRRGKETWLLAHLTPLDGYSLAVAVRCPGAVKTVQWTENALDLWWPSSS